MPTPKDVATATYTVAKGRSLVHDGKPYGAGDSVDLPVDDGARFQALGFLVGEDGSVSVNTNGPAVVSGVEIKEA